MDALSGGGGWGGRGDDKECGDGDENAVMNCRVMKWSHEKS